MIWHQTTVKMKIKSKSGASLKPRAAWQLYSKKHSCESLAPMNNERIPTVNRKCTKHTWSKFVSQGKLSEFVTLWLRLLLSAPPKMSNSSLNSWGNMIHCQIWMDAIKKLFQEWFNKLDSQQLEVEMRSLGRMRLVLNSFTWSYRAKSKLSTRIKSVKLCSCRNRRRNSVWAV